jgi:hypothetical protein
MEDKCNYHVHHGPHPQPYESSLENPTRFNIILTSLRTANILQRIIVHIERFVFM